MVRHRWSARPTDAHPARVPRGIARHRRAGLEAEMAVCASDRLLRSAATRIAVLRYTNDLDGTGPRLDAFYQLDRPANGRVDVPPDPDGTPFLSSRARGRGGAGG